MKIYTIVQHNTGLVLFKNFAVSQEHALDLLAQSAGWPKFSDITTEMLAKWGALVTSDVAPYYMVRYWSKTVTPSFHTVYHVMHRRVRAENVKDAVRQISELLLVFDDEIIDVTVEPNQTTFV